MTSAKFIYRDDDTELTFVWHGGAYIDVYAGAPQNDAPVDCINVWDYATDQPRIERSLEAFELRCRDWIDEQS